ncbi:MAG: endonuclease/exonuclease/phosphatase family protein [Lentisphaeria bacterium]|nr:endonuclease/exonuclease/phosphatase family protein [Lentisphaeria bacterium]
MRKLPVIILLFALALYGQDAAQKAPEAAAKPQEAVAKPAEAPKPAEAAKPAEAPKPQEAPKKAEPPKGPHFDTPVPKDPDSFRIASFNIRTRGDKAPNDWQARIPRILAILDKYELDSIGVQELTAQQKKVLLEKGTAFAAVGVGREPNKSGEHCCVVYRKDRFDCLDAGTFWLSTTPDVVGSHSWKTACRRICTWAKLKDKKTGKEFVHFNTHLDHRSEEARRNGAALIMSRMDDIAKGLPCFLTGDMNCRIATPSIQSFLAKMKNTKDVSETPHEGTFQTFHAYRYTDGKVTNGEIDFIFFNGDMRVLRHATINDHKGNEFPSDHFPVMAEIILK